MDFKKIIWSIRAIMLKPFFGKMGWLCYIGKPVSILNKKNIFVGKNVHIYPGARIESYQGGHIVIEDDVSISENVHIISSGGTLTIGSGTLIGPNVFISNSEHEYRDVTKQIVKQPLVIQEVNIGKENYIGAGVAALPGTITGLHSVIGAHSVLNRQFPDYAVIVGTPGEIIKKYDKQKQSWK